MSETGWLTYESDDPSIILRHPLTSDPLAYFTANATTVTVSGSGLQTFDPVRGICPNGSGGYRLISLNGRLPLTEAGQISYEVERDFLCMPTPEHYSFGFDPSATQASLSFTSNSGTAGSFLKKYAGGTVSAGIAGAVLGFGIHSAGKPDFIRVSLGWTGGKVGGLILTAVDGVVVDVAAKTAAAMVDMFENLYIGSDRQVVGSYMTNHCMRNLMISTKPPSFARHPMLRVVSMISDSISKDNNIDSDMRDNVTAWSLQRVIAKAGLSIGSLTATFEGGARLDNSLNGGTSGYIHNQIAAALASNPTVFVVRGSVNDCLAGRPSAAGWQAVIEGYITDIFANPSVKMQVWAGVISWVGSTSQNTSGYMTNMRLAEEKIQAAIAAWKAANPTDPRKLIYVPMYDRMGGENPQPGMFIGQVSGLWDDGHLSGYGHYVHGTALGQTILDNLN